WMSGALHFQSAMHLEENPMIQKLELDITGMTCDSCATHVESALQSVPGVADASVPGWESGRAAVTANPDVDTAALVAAVEQAGYRAAVNTPAPQRETPVPRSSNGRGGKDFDLIVIGTGGGGMAAVIEAAELGYRAAIIESGTIGGTCVNIGCVPSKTLIRAAESFHRAEHNPFEGVQTRAEELDWGAVVQQKDELVGELRQGKYVDVLAAYSESITLIQGWGQLTPDGKVAVNDRLLSADKVVIATGARPKVLPLEGIDEVNVLNSTTAMELAQLPASLLVIGGRAIALELGQTFARFGVRVTILQRSPRLIPDHEPEISESLADTLRDEGLSVHTGVTLLAIRAQNGGKIVTAEVGGARREFQAEQVLMAVGRTPNTQDIGLEATGVEMDARGFIEVDGQMQTSAAHIYAVGDVTVLPKFVYVAAAAGSVAAENALAGTGRTLDLSSMPDVIFTDPAAASAGLTEQQAVEQGYAVKISTLPMEYVPRALAARDTRGLVKLVADAATDKLLGAHILAPEAGDMIQTATLALKFGLTVQDLRETLFPYLTNVEAIKLATLSFEKDVAMLSCCAG
ncbi:MAG: mercury(II) reductase, partial [Anaerolineales bacterium]